MKRLFCILLCICLCCSLWGCRKNENPPVQVPVEFFYLRSTFTYNSTDTVLGSELRESAGHEEDIVYLLNLYFSGPKNESLAQPFPKGCSVISCTQEKETASLVISDRFAELTGMELTAACVCLAKTLSGLTGCGTVVLRAQTELLDGKKTITIQDGTTVLLDDYISPSQPE